MSRSLIRTRVVVLLCLTLASTNAIGSESVDGTFTATRACDAYLSFNKGTNPGAVRTIPGQGYAAREVNAASDFSWVRVVIPDIENAERWVARECGVPHFTVAGKPPAGGGAAGARGSGGACRVANTFDSYVLAVTWQPGFCEHFEYNGRKPECDAMAAGEMAVSNITLHGLWPNKQSCGTHYDSCGGPPLDLSEDTVSKIAPWMPNFFYERTFGQYEWRKHGVCQAKDDDAYFLTAVDAVKVVDASPLGQYIRDHIGAGISTHELFEIARKETGAPVKNMTVVCAQQKYLQEIRLGLSTRFELDAGLRGLLEGGPELPRVQGCSGDELVIERSGPS